jgi:hypothetical protein
MTSQSLHREPEIVADLECEVDSARVTIRSSGNTLIVEVPDVATGLKLLQLGSPGDSRRRRLHQVKKLLERLRARVDFRIAGTSILRIGDLRGGGMWKLLGFPSMVVSWGPTIRHLPSLLRPGAGK